ncbi:hypothetical protein M0804_011035 [Polistes exclamans]|nr:hypothetical protein M0804_011035 [Polistes exclamans]
MEEQQLFRERQLDDDYDESGTSPRAFLAHPNPLNSDMIVSRGERLSLRCLPVSDEHITWYKDNEVLLHSTVRVKVMRQTLKFRYFDSRDAGTYGCLIEKYNDYNQTIEWRNVTLRVEEALQNDGYREEDGKIGNVLEALRPRDETNELEIEARNLPETRSLHLDSEKSDAELDNNKGENEMVGEHNNTLPDRPPTFNNSDEMHKPVVKPAGNMVRLRCPSTGNPRPNITWLKNNEEPKRSLGTIIRTKWTLRLEDLVPDDSGNYTCIVCNRIACINHTFKVDIIERFPHKPYINEDFPKNVTALVNSSVTFRCPIVADLEPYIQWVKVAEYPGDQEDTPKGTLLQAGIVENPEELKLYNVTEKDEGWYTCIAQNTLGETFSSAYLRVVENKEISRESLEGVNENQDGGARKYNVTLEEKSLNVKMKMERKEKASTKYKDFKSQLKEKTMKKMKQEDSHRMENSNEKELTKLKPCDQKSSKEKEKKKEKKGEVEEEYQFYKNFIIAKLRKMNPKQRLYAENLINRVLYEGSVERLSLSTTITLQPYDYYNHQQLQGAGGIVNTIKEEKQPTLTTFDLI